MSATAEIQKSTRHPLTVPVDFEGKTHDSITLRRIKGKDIRDMEREESDIEKTFFLIARLSGWPPEGVDELDGADFEAIAKVIEGFMGKRKRR